MLKPRAGTVTIAALLAFATAGSVAVAADQPDCAKPTPPMSDTSLTSSEIPVTDGAQGSWIALSGGKGGTMMSSHFEGVGVFDVQVKSVGQFVHGDLDGDGDLDAAAYVLLAVPSRTNLTAGDFGNLVVWRNDNGRPRAVSARDLAQNPQDVKLSVTDGKVSAAWTARDWFYTVDMESPMPEPRARTMTVELRGDALTDAKSPQANNQVDPGPLTGVYFTGATGAYGLTVRKDGTFTRRGTNYAADPGSPERNTLLDGRITERTGNTAVGVTTGGNTPNAKAGVRMTFTFDPATKRINVNDEMELCLEGTGQGFCF